jgi:hypothetical protein
MEELGVYSNWVLESCSVHLFDSEKWQVDIFFILEYCITSLGAACGTRHPLTWGNVSEERVTPVRTCGSLRTNTAVRNRLL